MMRFEKCKKWLYENWGYQLFRGEKENYHGWKSGFIVTGNNYHRRFTSIKAIEEMIAKDEQNWRNRI